MFICLYVYICVCAYVCVFILKQIIINSNTIRLINIWNIEPFLEGVQNTTLEDQVAHMYNCGVLVSNHNHSKGFPVYVVDAT